MSEEHDAERKVDDSSNQKNGEKLASYLLVALQMRHVVVLAGSGTSIGAGGPSIKDLWKECMEIEGAQEIADNLNCEENIETLLSNCEAFLQVRRNNQKVLDFVKKCKEKIHQMCSFEMNNLNSHKIFLHRLSRRRTRDPRLKVFTTNYDVCFETAASHQGIIVIDGFSFSNPRYYDPRFFDFDIVRRSANTHLSDNYLEGVYQLFKMHGSVSWLRRNGQVIEGNVTPQDACMVFPASGKYQQSYVQPHLELMARYLAALREPNTCLIIIGFGFNDNHLSEPILSAIKSNSHLNTIIVAPSIEEKIEQEGNNDYWRTLCELNQRSESVLFVQSSFGDFAKLIPDLRSLTPAEKMAKSIKEITNERTDY